MAGMYASFGVDRYLTSLKAGGAIVRGDMIVLPRGASESMRLDAEYVCEKNAKFDWKHEEDAA